MKLDPPFIKKNVQAGDPVTAQAWNDIVNAMRAVYDHVEAEAASLKVQVVAPGIHLASVRVTATRDDGILAEAIGPIPPATIHTFPGLSSGNYTIRAEAPGFDVVSMNLAVPPAGLPATQNITLTKRGNFMPMTFGKTLATVLAELALLNIAVNHVLDVTGASVPVANPGAYGQSFVLMQFPLAGTPVVPGESAQLVISAALTAESSIEMPSLVGLTLAEATAALQALDLKVGKVSTKSSSSTTPIIGPGNEPPPVA